MKLTVTILVCMAVLAASVPAAAAAWGLRSASTVLLAVAVLCLEVSLALVAARLSRARRDRVRFGAPLRHRHFPIHHGPLPARPIVRRRVPAPRGTTPEPPDARRAP